MRKNKEERKKPQEVNHNLQTELPQMSLMSLLQFGSQTLLSEAIRAEITQSLGRGFYQHSESKKDLKGYRHGTRKTTLDTPIGPIVYERPRVVGFEFQSQFHTPYMRRPEEFATQICDMYVNGTSTRKVKKSFIRGDWRKGKVIEIHDQSNHNKSSGRV